MPSDLKEERRREILMAALQAFSAKGYDKTTVSDIVRYSGLSKGTLYWYFENKQAIFEAMIEMVFDDIGGYFKKTLTESRDQPPPQRLRNMLTGMDTMIDEMMAFAGLYADFFGQAWQSESVRENLARHYNDYIESLVPIIQEGIDKGDFRPVDAYTASRTILGAVDGFWFQQILNIGDAQKLIELHADLVIRGLMNTHDTDNR